jgi:hypothetical protein
MFESTPKNIELGFFIDSDPPAPRPNEIFQVG